MTTETGYNGWTNYETWNVACWIQNEYGGRGRWQLWSEIAADYLRDEYVAEIEADTWKQEAYNAMASVMKDEYEEAVPELTGFYADLLNAALSEVNWHEIARHYVDDAFDEVAEELDAEGAE